MQLSLAGWSLNKLFRATESPLKLVDFPAFTRDTFGIEAVELNNIYFESTERAYLDRIVAAAAKAKSKLLNVAVDEPGDLSSTDVSLRGWRRWSGTHDWIPIAAADSAARAIRANSGGKADWRARKTSAIANVHRQLSPRSQMWASASTKSIRVDRKSLGHQQRIRP